MRMIKKPKRILFKTILITVMLNLLFLATPVLAVEDAALMLSPIRGTYGIGDLFQIKIWAKTGGNNIDTIRANLNFPAALLEVQEIVLSSVYTVSAGGNSFDNLKGEITWAGGVPKGTIEDNVFAIITFKTKARGQAEINFSPGTKVISNGQDVPFNVVGGVYTLEKEILPPAPAIKEEKLIPAEVYPTIKNTISIIPRPENTPIISGKANLAEAIIMFDIDEGLMLAASIADEKGNWKWIVPEGLFPGVYRIKIVAIDPKDSSNKIANIEQFRIITKPPREKGKSLIGIILSIPREFKKVERAGKLFVNINLINFGEVANPGAEAILDYLIRDKDDNVVFRESEERDIAGEKISFIKKISLPKEIGPGQYSLQTKVTYNVSDVADDSDDFEIIERSILKSIVLPIVLIFVLIPMIIWVLIKKQRS